MKHDWKYLISKYRRNRLTQFLADKCHNFIGLYENTDWNFRSNGEFHLLRTLAGCSLPFSCIFDVGANVGEWTLAAHHFFPRAEIHAFEIVPYTSQILEQKAQGIQEIVVCDFGLSDSSGEVTVQYDPSKSTVSSLVHSAHVNNARYAQCRVVSGDEYIAEQGIEHINFLKIDVEGAEHTVLKGLQNTIQAGKIDIIQFEYGKQNIISHFLLYDFYALLNRHGYSIGKIFPTYVEFRDYSLWDENFLLSNFVAVRSEQDELIKQLST